MGLSFEETIPRELSEHDILSGVLIERSAVFNNGKEVKDIIWESS